MGGKNGIKMGDVGLAALMSSLSNVSTEALNQKDHDYKGKILELPLDLLQKRHSQPRKYFDKQALEELASSIRTNGVLQPIVVRTIPGKQRYEVIAGERRYRASKIAGIDRIPAILMELSDEKVSIISLLENIQRERLNPIEEAEALRSLIDQYGMTHEQIAKSICKSRSSVSNSLRLLNLAEPVQEYIASGELDVGHGKVLLSLSSSELQHEVSRISVERKMSVKTLEAHIKLIEKTRTLPKNHTVSTISTDKLGQKLKEFIGKDIEIICMNQKKDKIIISNELLMNQLMKLLMLE